ncbi:MAG: winged helix-turn-helix transcriptional regulator [Rhizobiaceae bacterium]|nr:winged helix-turn-helix transcriptional regulator [Rhizobiaceae bacterium]
MIEKKDDDFLGVNIKGLMMTLLARWNEQMDLAREKTEFADIRQSDMRVFGQLRGRTVKLSVIHKEMGFSRQAAQQAVERLVERGVLRVEMAEGNKRDKMVSITEKGQELRTLAALQIRDIEENCADIIGEDGKETMRQLLHQLVKDGRQ